MELSYELDCEYHNRPRWYQLSHPYGHSTAARRRFANNQEREEYFAELAAALAWVEPSAPTPREQTYEDVLAEAGCGFVGQSIVEPHKYQKRTVLHGGGSQ